MRKLFEALLGKKLEFEEYQSLFLPDVAYFFDKLNALILSKCHLTEHKKHMMGKGPANEPKTRSDVEHWQKKNKQVAFGNLFAPIFDSHACLIGFEIRQELVAMMYKNHNFSTKVLERAVKTCMFMNKLISTG